jgi:hypothetical protein
MQSHDRPDSLHHAKRPRALQEAIDGAERAGPGERQNEPRAAIFHGIAEQHGGDGEQAEGGKCVHVVIRQ